MGTRGDSAQGWQWGRGSAWGPGTRPQEALTTHPACCMWTPLLVGLAGADWVSEDVLRMRCGRAFAVACRSEGTRDVGGGPQDGGAGWGAFVWLQ